MTYNIFKKKFMIFLLVPFVISQCIFAQPQPIDESDLVLGGISIDDSIDKVIEIYGQPLNIKKHNQDTLEYSYKNIRIYFDRHSRIDYVINFSAADDANLITTPRGIVIGNSVEDLIKVYGSPKFKNFLDDSTIIYGYHSEKRFSTFHLTFLCDSKTNKIIKITLYDAV